MNREYVKKLKEKAAAGADVQSTIDYNTSRRLTDYDAELPAPNFPEHSFEQAKREGWILTCIHQLLDKREQEGRIDPVRIVDVGCGQAGALQDMASTLLHTRFQGSLSEMLKAVDLVGISFTDYRDDSLTHDPLKLIGIDYQVGNMIDLPQLLRDRKNSGPVDLFLASYSIGYVQPSRMRAKVVRDIYRHLRVGGYASMEYTHLIGKPESMVSGVFRRCSEDAVERYYANANDQWAQQGLDIHHHANCAFIKDAGGMTIYKKDKTPFFLPIEYDANGQLDEQHFYEEYLSITSEQAANVSWDVVTVAHDFFSQVKRAMFQRKHLSAISLQKAIEQFPKELRHLVRREIVLIHQEVLEFQRVHAENVGTDAYISSVLEDLDSAMRLAA